MNRLIRGLLMTGVAASSAAPVMAQEEVATRLVARDYLMARDYEIALARSAAPAPIGAEATVLVFTTSGYETAFDGENGFTCLVERSWSSPYGPHMDFYNPRLRAPICYNAAASRSPLQEYLRRTQLALEGKSWSEVRDGVLADIASGRLRAPEGLAMSYMLSDAQLLGTETGRFVPHLMFYVPYATSADLGAQEGNPHAMFFEYEGGPFAALIVPARDWVAGPGGR